MIRLPFDVPVDPDRPEARQLLTDELSKQEYQAAKPTWFDKLVGDFFDWINSLEFGGTQGPPALGMLLLLVGILVLILIAFLIFGLPRLNRRSTVTGSLFGDDDERNAAQMRAAAEVAAAAGDFTLAVAEMFRSIARGMAERTVLTTSPGTTAHDFATRAAVAFASSADDLRASAAAFDEVRYLGTTGTRAQFDLVARLERTLRTAKPTVLEQVDA